MQKKKKMTEKKKMKERTTLQKAANMIGLGPISDATIEYHEKMTKNHDTARKHAIKEFLGYQLGYQDKELDEIEIKETCRASKDDIIYFAVGDAETIREIYFRKADSGNDEIVVRNYIPPQLHARFMAINENCKEIRSKN